MRRVLVCVLFLFGCFAMSAASSRRPSIYIGSVVQGTDARQFQQILENALSARGMAVVADRDQADAILSGEVSGWGELGGQFHVALADREGHSFWQGSVPRPQKLRKTHCDPRDTATALAENVARQVDKAMRKR